MSDLDKYAGEFAKVSPGMHTAWKHLGRILDQHGAIIGRSKLEFQDDVLPDRQTGLHRVSAIVPPQASFTVTPLDGKFMVAIANPQNVQPQSVQILQNRAIASINARNAPIVHNLQSATDVNFNAASNIVDYGISPVTAYTVQDPNITRFFRLRSSYDGINWNQWQIYSSALTCGPVGVQSGLLRTAALTQVNAAYTPTTQPLTAATGVGVNQATINIASFVVQYPAPIGNKSYNSGSITPLNDSTFYYVYCLDPTFAGGAQTYFATANNPDVTANDALIFLGTITTPAHGGGGTGGSGGGGGPCFTPNTRVLTMEGIKRMVDVIAGSDEILTQRGLRKVKAVIEHDYDGPTCRMGNGEFVTPDHRFWLAPGGSHEGWLPARNIFPPGPDFHGVVVNLEIDGDGSDEEQCYTLANGWLAHNLRK
jgi:hypothetical protein